MSIVFSQKYRNLESGTLIQIWDYMYATDREDDKHWNPHGVLNLKDHGGFGIVIKHVVDWDDDVYWILLSDLSVERYNRDWIRVVKDV